MQRGRLRARGRGRGRRRHVAGCGTTLDRRDRVGRAHDRRRLGGHHRIERHRDHHGDRIRERLAAAGHQRRVLGAAVDLRGQLDLPAGADPLHVRVRGRGIAGLPTSAVMRACTAAASGHSAWRLPLHRRTTGAARALPRPEAARRAAARASYPISSCDRATTSIRAGQAAVRSLARRWRCVHADPVSLRSRCGGPSSAASCRRTWRRSPIAWRAWAHVGVSCPSSRASATRMRSRRDGSPRASRAGTTRSTCAPSPSSPAPRRPCTRACGPRRSRAVVARGPPMRSHCSTRPRSCSPATAMRSRRSTRARSGGSLDAIDRVVRAHRIAVHVLGHALFEHRVLARAPIGAGVVALALAPVRHVDAALARSDRRRPLRRALVRPDPAVARSAGRCVGARDARGHDTAPPWQARG